MKSAYDFYKLTDTTKADMVGNSFREDERDIILFPIKLTEEEGWANYNERYGLLFLTSIIPTKKGPFMRLGAMSPDDLDRHLDFTGELPSRESVVELLLATIDPNQEYTYHEILEYVRVTLQKGSITS
jgi:hypothetical protein